MATLPAEPKLLATMPEIESHASWMSSLSAEERGTWLASLSRDDAAVLEHDWRYWARPAQLPPPGNWRTWLILAGRGFGKTRAGAEWVRSSVRDFRYVNIIGATADDARDIMIEGESGILAICPDDERPVYLPSKRRLEWPNGAWSLIFTADEPERLRGKQHARLWADELAAWRYASVVVTTTPKPTKLVQRLITDPTTVVTRGSTYDNAANLAPAFFAQIINRYEGTRLGRQELNAELLLDVPGALWVRLMFEERRPAPDLTRVVVAIDPAASSNEDSDETGIIVAGKGIDGDYYVLADRSCRLSPDGWARRAVAAFDEFQADRIVAEVNNGGEMVGAVVHTVRESIPYTAVHASRGKAIRAEPIAALYEQARVWHTGEFDELEDQLVTWTPDSGDSPDRLDALVWALTELHQIGAIEPLDPETADAIAGFVGR
jgi:phage terminase large subunit-like protein